MLDTPYLLRVLGGASLEGPGGSLRGPAAQRHRLALLALLATGPDQRRPRETVAAYLWPDSGVNTRHVLNVAVHAVRTELGSAALRSLGSDLALNPNMIECDAVRLQRSLEQGDIQSAIALYRGPFLDGFFLDGAPEFERWQGAERARLHRTFSKGLEDGAEAAERRGALPQAIEYWRRLAELEPESERVTIRLMRALEQSGDRAAALKAAEAHTAFLASEFEAEPNPDVITLAQRMRREPVRPAPTASKPAADAPISINDTSLTQPRRPFPTRTAAALGAVLALGLLWLAFTRVSNRASQPHSVAVLAFDNLSGDPSGELFSDGLAEDLLNALAQIQGLRVAARTSAFVFKGKQVDVREIGRTLGVQSVVEGSVRRQGDRMRITAQLIRTADGFHVWSGTYDGELADVFALQDSVALAIAEALRVPLGLAERTPRQRGGTHDPTALELYLLGAQRWSQRADLGQVREAIRYYEAAIAADPEFALAHAGLADALLVLPFYDPAVSMADAVRRARPATRRAIELSPTRPEPHATAGRLSFYGEWDFAAARRHLDRAVELGPSSVWAYYYRRDLNIVMEDWDAALRDARQALALDPLSPPVVFTTGAIVTRVEGPAAALPLLEAAVAIPAPPHEWLHEYAIALAQLGRQPQSAAAFQRWATTLGVADTARAAVLADVHGNHADMFRTPAWWSHRETHADDLRVAEVMAQVLEEAAAGPGYEQSDLVFYYLYVSPEAFLRVAEQAAVQRHPWVLFIGHPSVRGLLRDEPRYAALLRRIGLPADRG